MPDRHHSSFRAPVLHRADQTRRLRHRVVSASLVVAAVDEGPSHIITTDEVHEPVEARSRYVRTAARRLETCHSQAASNRAPASATAGSTMAPLACTSLRTPRPGSSAIDSAEDRSPVQREDAIDDDDIRVGSSGATA